ncbi:hypothetical protein [Desulfovibrio oxyclinae]|jgi:hypothetical protein|uniref:hypothetical protein n=1 Tax=Desulfovibrio oxyclinae TaxID=63560 RepID=UPI000378E168|nr:hypothetical protein [Desulfovibrio oxyclinae]
MALPAYWWLLLPAVLGQCAFFLLSGALRPGEKTLQGGPWLLTVLAASLLSGLAYGAVQSDPVFIAAQCFLAATVFRIWRKQ